MDFLGLAPAALNLNSLPHMVQKRILSDDEEGTPLEEEEEKRKKARREEEGTLGTVFTLMFLSSRTFGMSDLVP